MKASNRLIEKKLRNLKASNQKLTDVLQECGLAVMDILSMLLLKRSVLKSRLNNGYWTT